jgi:hypothetical protein
MFLLYCLESLEAPGQTEKLTGAMKHPQFYHIGNAASVVKRARWELLPSNFLVAMASLHSRRRALAFEPSLTRQTALYWEHRWLSLASDRRPGCHGILPLGGA